MKKKIITLLVILCIMLIPFVWYKVKSRTDDTLINSVLDIEKATYDVNNLKISYKEFNSKTKKYCSDYLPSMFGFTIYSKQIGGISLNFTEEECNELSLDDAKKVFDQIKEETKELGLKSLCPDLSYSAIQLSKVYSVKDESNKSLSLKYIYVKRELTDYNNISVYTKYTFVKEKNRYVLFEVKGMRQPENPVIFGDKIEL